ncbi:MAG TPA: SDR family oxidoreductase [Actinomycetes bacterium]|nr:SDR family oxidoreductase [Actinomycetes bacterium]
MLLDDKSVLVTGASRGIGRAIALEAARQGADVALVARSADDLRAVADEVRGSGRRGVGIVADVGRPREARRVVQEALDALGRVDVLVNCAGTGIGPVPVEETTDEQWQTILDTNLNGPWWLVQALAPHLTARGSGAIVNVSSLGAKYKPGATSAAYTASKSALSGLTRQLAMLLGPKGIRVNAILPGNTVLERPDASWASLSEEDKERMLHDIPLGRFGTPEDQARAAVWLASDYNTWVTGENLAVAGGERMG